MAAYTGVQFFRGHGVVQLFSRGVLRRCEQVLNECCVCMCV